MKSLSVHELADWLADSSRTPPRLLDVRETWEYQICRIEGSELLPIREVAQNWQSLEQDQPVVCICHHGGRSAQVALFLERQGMTTFNLSGGVDAWARQVDASMATY
jgi:rhodanese-related sulfurtransferase